MRRPSDESRHPHSQLRHPSSRSWRLHDGNVHAEYLGQSTSAYFDMRAARSTPVVPTYQWCCDRIIALYERAGLEPDMGSRLFGAFVRAGLPAPTMIGAGRVEGGADSYVYRYIAATMRSLLPMFERLGVATAEEVDVDTLEARMRAKALEHASSLVLPTFVAAWARTPT